MLYLKQRIKATEISDYKMIKPRFEIFCSYCTTDYNELISSFDTSRSYCSAHLLSDDDMIGSIEYFHIYEYPLVFCISSCQGIYVIRLAISSFSPFIPECLSDTYPDDQALEIAVRSQISTLLN